MSKKVINIQEHAHKILKENIDKAEVIVQDIQSQYEAENEAKLQERIAKCQGKILQYELELKHTDKDPQETYMKLMIERQKYQDLMNATPQNNNNFNEDDAIVFEDDIEDLMSQNDTLDELEKSLDFKVED